MIVFGNSLPQAWRDLRLNQATRLPPQLARSSICSSPLASGPEALSRKKTPARNPLEVDYDRMRIG